MGAFGIVARRRGAASLVVAWLAVAPAVAVAQSQLGGQQPAVAPPRPAVPAAAPAANAPTAQPRPQAQGQPPRPAGQAQRPAQAGQRPAGQQARPQGQQARPQGQRPGQAAQRPNQRRAAAGAAAGAAGAAGAAAAAPPQPPQPPAPPPEPQPTIGSVTGLPLPRFAALRSDNVNLRVGPGTNFPIEWRYQRRDLPVMILREHDQWRRIRDMEGAEGWIAASNLQPGRRTFMVRPPQAAAPQPAAAQPASAPAASVEVPLRRRPEEQSAPIARLRVGVVGRIRGCEAGSPWCEVQVQDHRGFLRRSEMFGIGAEEEIR
jgi:SH3-like domain-containing protein